MSDTIQEVYDVIIVGAGPCGLATASRLREHTPAALFTDEEHRRYHWIGKYGKQVALKHVKSGKVSHARHARASRPEYKMLVLDATDNKWLGRWNHLFKTYDISHLRSPMLWHVDPLDRDALLAHAYYHQREDELVEIRNCVGKEISKHASKKMAKRQVCGGKQEARIDINLRDRNDYYTPSQALFSDHCAQVAGRYDLEGQLIRKETLQDIDYGEVRGISVDGAKLFTVTTDKTRHYYAKAVVLAVGPANTPKIPPLPSAPFTASGVLPQACHSMQIKQFPDALVQSRIAAGSSTNILIIGGGLTSAQLAVLALKKGVTKVWHLMRGPLRIKHFDVDLSWMGKYKNAEQARFWTADSDLERLAIIKEARGGGSLTPLYYKKVKKCMAAGTLELRTLTTLVDAELKDIDGSSFWSVKTEPPIDGLPAFDYIYFATGIQTDFACLPYLQTMLQKYPIHGHGGFPCINEDLMWKDGVPLFLAGRLGALQIGPAAPNIGGAKVAAERVAWAIEDTIRPDSFQDDHEESNSGLASYLSGHGNMYSILQEENN
ncbi:FAD/NAD(P)-binding domain-containing protein [Trichoderma longibrachiatum]|uniref:FAD/NAD(P)-binding domain-containing protein n=1 Tax=Trichoderma longibrachiatum ATCC 18648 TaxID=983965 RepID=A0A2T4C1Q1_TRILO|nr:FAD/NAD(P)-binding domain-containing protein [Trichoderma longibrachiatum ATCC 18648]